MILCIIIIVSSISQSHRDDALLLHASGRVVEVGELHRHLVVDGQQELLALLQLALQLLPLDGVQLGGPCGERVRDTSFSGETGDDMWSTVIRVFRSVSLGAVLTQTNVIYYSFLFTAL